MKCTSKTEYDCFYLEGKENAEEFLKWIKKHCNYEYDYIIHDDFLVIEFDTSNEEKDIYLEDLLGDELDGYRCDYNRWYVIKNEALFDYSPEYFFKWYNLSAE